MMPSDTPLPERRQRLVRGLLMVLMVGCGGMWLLSYSAYTSVGLDLAWGAAPTITVGHLRLRWPGDGSLRLGFGQLIVSEAVTPEVDLAAALFQPPRRDQARSIWNTIGFWHINRWSDPYYQERWLGVPAWLPLPFLYLVYRRRNSPT